MKNVEGSKNNFYCYNSCLFNGIFFIFMETQWKFWKIDLIIYMKFELKNCQVFSLCKFMAVFHFKFLSWIWEFFIGRREDDEIKTLFFNYGKLCFFFIIIVSYCWWLFLNPINYIIILTRTTLFSFFYIIKNKDLKNKTIEAF